MKQTALPKYKHDTSDIDKTITLEDYKTIMAEINIDRDALRDRAMAVQKEYIDAHAPFKVGTLIAVTDVYNKTPVKCEVVDFLVNNRDHSIRPLLLRLRKDGSTGSQPLKLYGEWRYELL